MNEVQKWWNNKITKRKPSRWLMMNYVSQVIGINGFVAEFGIYKGKSLKYLCSLFPKVYGFDSFKGLPEDWIKGRYKGHFSIDESKLKFPTNAIVYKGWFNETIPLFLEDNKQNAQFIHIDCDIYSSTKDVMMMLNDRIVNGTYILFDELFGYKNWREHEALVAYEWEKKYKKQLSPLMYNKQKVLFIVEC